MTRLHKDLIDADLSQWDRATAAFRAAHDEPHPLEKGELLALAMREAYWVVQNDSSRSSEARKLVKDARRLLMKMGAKAKGTARAKTLLSGKLELTRGEPER
jgi:hypothetical protein